MFTLSNQYNELLDLYKIMADDGYKRSDGAIVKKAYSDAEPHKFAEQLKVIIKYLNVKTALDYGSGGSDLNNTKLNNGRNFKEYIGLSKVYPFEPAREKKLKKKSDLVLCFDVLEHIFINDIPWVINDLFKNAKKGIIINVACYEAAALLPNGENAHITVRPPAWWLGQVECVSNLHPNIYWALFASPGYQNPKFLGMRRMKDRLDSSNFFQPYDKWN